MTTKIDVDYLVVGAGAMGMAFVDEILTHTDATVAMVDKNFKPGGHWNYAYPFVRLHQTSKCYGVNSTELGGDRVDEVGFNKGCYELASGGECLAYFDNVMRRRFLPSGRVNFLPMCEYNHKDGKAVNLLSGEEYEFSARKIVNATYMNVTVPATTPPAYTSEGGAVIVPVNDLPKVSTEYENIVIVGSGKTGMDACLFLLSNGCDPERITWVVSSDSWLFDRFTVEPGRKFSDPTTQYAIGALQTALEASDYDDFFKLMEDKELIKRIDPSVKPTRWRCATFTPTELAELRKIKHVVRKGYLESVSPTEMKCSKGVYKTPSNAVFVDCSADGLPKMPLKKVFEGNTITLQNVRMCQQVYSAGFIGNVEANVDVTEDRKNELTQPVPMPYNEEDYLNCFIGNSRNMLIWLTEPAVVKWINEARIDLFSPLLNFDCPETAEHIAAMKELMEQAVPKMEQLVASKHK